VAAMVPQVGGGGGAGEGSKVMRQSGARNKV
jgi:hypothetical protein